MKILVCDHNEETRENIGNIVTELGHKAFFALSGEHCVEIYSQQEPDLVLLEIDLPHMDGFDTTIKLRESTHSFAQWTPIFYMRDAIDDEVLARGIEVGGDDFLVKPFSKLLLKAKLKSIRRLVTLRENLMDYGKQLQDVNDKLLSTNQLLSELSLKDPLTRLGNRRAFEENLLRSCRTGHRVGKPLSLLMIDVDHFKNYNDTYGHQAGDLCLQQVSQVVDKQLHRAADFGARYGGEEFAVILPHTPKEGALNVAERIRKDVEELMIQNQGTPNNIVTVSVGVATIEQEKEFDGEQLVGAADAALYQAKDRGRNIVVCANDKAYSSRTA